MKNNDICDLKVLLTHAVETVFKHEESFNKKFRPNDTHELTSFYMSGSSCRVEYKYWNDTIVIYIGTDEVIDWLEEVINE